MTEPRVRNTEGLWKKFQDFDEQDVYDAVCEGAKKASPKNFVVLFGPQNARVAVDLDADDFRDLFHLSRTDYPVRWINFWNTTEQGQAINIIGDKYGFTRRLRASITAWDKYRHINRAADADKRRLKERLKAEPEHGSVHVEKADLESGLNSDSGDVAQAGASAVALRSEHADPEVMENFKVIQNSLNYTTTDYGADFVCFGANWLHVRPTEGAARDPGLVPPRHWAWFALCADDDQITNTVISIHEAPNYETPPKGIDEATWQAKELASMRTNTIAVLEQLSTRGMAKYVERFFLLKSIRETAKADRARRTTTTVLPEKVTETAAANLFYYLFEDYSAVMPVLNSSGRMVENLTRRVLGSARKGDALDTADVIPALHKLGKDLRQLHHLFTSYKNLFESILKKPSLGEGAEARIVRLEGQARDRFQRLSDRNQLLMLNTIKQYIDETTELSSTYFNLTAQKDSQATARLTRSATLLAKLSVFFLPISFITSYFSVQIPELNNAYTAKTYWYTFAVVATVSFLSLFFFSKLLMFVSDRLDEIAEIISRRVGNTFWRDKSREKKE